MSYEQERHHHHEEEPQALLEVSSVWPSRIDVHIHLPQGGSGGSADVLALLNQILDTLTAQQGEITEMSAELDSLTAAVTENTSVDQSAITLLQDLAAKIQAAANDPAAITALATDLRASSQQLADAIVANTPAGPVVEPPVEPPVEA